MSEAARMHGPAQPVVIAAGTPITCELGHTICVTARDWRANEPLAAELFTHWQTAAPRAGDMFPRCSVCGAVAHREVPDGVELHTPDGWRLLKNALVSGIATKADLDDAAARLNSKIEEMAQRFHAVLWKHTVGIILNVLAIGALLMWFFR
jgi:hypothetical protein